MGTWGCKTFENDGAADWLYDLEEAEQHEFLLNPIRDALKAKGKIDIDDCLESLASAEVMAGSRYEPPKDVPRIARSWIKRTAFVAKDADLKLAIRAVEKICKNSELKDTWESEGKLAPWVKEVKQLSKRLANALRATAPQRKAKVKKQTLAELIIAVGSGAESSRRGELQQKLSRLSNPDRPVGGKGLNSLTPLHWVASQGMIPEAKLLLERGATVNIKVSIMSPPIVFAMDNNHLEMVALLLKAGADRQRALFNAISENNLEMLKLVIAAGADLEAKADGGWNAILWAAYHGAVKALELLLELGARLDSVTELGKTPLHKAAEGSHFDVVKLLVARGAKLDAVNAEGKTALDLAYEAKATEIVEFLRQAGASERKKA
jgi:hypothetical protein